MKTQRVLSDEQERLRIEGLRALARIIARHVLAHPEHHGEGTGGALGAQRADDHVCASERWVPRDDRA